MVKRRWFAGFSGTLSEAKPQLEELIIRLVEPFGAEALVPALNRQQLRDGAKDDPYAFAVWRGTKPVWRICSATVDPNPRAWKTIPARNHAIASATSDDWANPRSLANSVA